MTHPCFKTHGLSTEVEDDGITRAVAISLLGDKSYGITFTTTNPECEPFETRLRLSPAAMTILSECLHEAMHNMHKYKIKEK